MRNHACLAFWSGDNENATFGTENTTDFPGYRSAAFGIEPIITELDRERYFFPSSPYGGDRYSSATRGTTHNTNFIGEIFRYVNTSDMSDYRTYFSRYISRFCAEQTTFGMSFVSSLRKYLTDDDIFGDDLSMLEYHTKNNPCLFKTLFEFMCIMARKIFGDYESGEDRILKLQMLQCDWTRMSFELYRKHKGFAWGLVYWMFNDCWPASSGWSFIDYYACPKPGYYTFKRCSAPVVACISESGGKLTVHVSNDSLQAVSGKATLYSYDTLTSEERVIKNIEFGVDANAVSLSYECDWSKIEAAISTSAVLICDLSCELGEDRAIFVPNRFADLGIKYVLPEIVCETSEELCVRANAFIPYAIIDTPYLLSDNCFTMKRGEVRTLKKIKKL